MKNTGDLLRQYVQEGSEEAFGEVVRSHIDLVFSTALRRTGGDASLAEDITQMVFIDLAGKARSLAGSPSLAGWLYRHTCFRAAQAVRSEHRRMLREQTAMVMNACNDDTDLLWKQMGPLLDAAMEGLGMADREARSLSMERQRSPVWCLPIAGDRFLVGALVVGANCIVAVVRTPVL
jgi:DNA-directed RNA polymerase specialized sigma24 family protein